MLFRDLVLLAYTSLAMNILGEARNVLAGGILLKVSSPRSCNENERKQWSKMLFKCVCRRQRHTIEDSQNECKRKL